jgi:putative flippase GtrA
MMDRIRELGRKYGVLRAAQFGLAGVAGFLVLEAIVIGGLYGIYGKLEIPSDVYSSPTLLGLDILAALAGVTVGFLVNERTTVRDLDWQTRSRTVRWLKYQGVYILGNAVTIGVQLALLAGFALSPAVGNIFGAIVAYPPSYFISMKLVWRPGGGSRSA